MATSLEPFANVPDELTHGPLSAAAGEAPQVADVLTGQHRLLEHLDRYSVAGPILPETTKGYMDSLTDEEFKQWLLRINGICRGMPPSQRTFDVEAMSITEVTTVGTLTMTVEKYTPPEQEDRLPLMLEAFHAAQRVKDPAVAGLLLGIGINFTHLLDDGHGRTGRVVHELLVRGYDGSKQAQTRYALLLQEGIGRQHTLVDYRLVHDALMQDFVLSRKRSLADAAGYVEALPSTAHDDVEMAFFPKWLASQPHYYLHYSPLSDETKTRLQTMMNSRPVEIRDTATFQWLLQANRQGPDYIGVSELAGTRLIAYGNLFLHRDLPRLSESEALELLAVHREVRKEFVQYAIQSAAELDGSDAV